jgi:hypothetical protein
MDASMERRERVGAHMTSVVGAGLERRVRRFLRVWIVAVAALTFVRVFGGNESRDHGPHLVTAEALRRRWEELRSRRLDRTRRRNRRGELVARHTVKARLPRHLSESDL